MLLYEDYRYSLANSIGYVVDLSKISTSMGRTIQKWIRKSYGKSEAHKLTTPGRSVSKHLRCWIFILLEEL